MARVKLKQLEVGQELHKDALGANGRLLLKSGTIIEEKHLEIFRTWGVTEVDIVGDGPNRDESTLSLSALPSEIKDQIYQKLKLQFIYCNFRHPLIKELVTYQKERLIKEFMEDENKTA